MSLLKIISFKNVKKPKGQKGKPTRLAIVSFEVGSPAELKVTVRKNKVVASLLEVSEPGRERGRLLHDELSRQPDETPGGDGPPGGQGRS